MSSRGGGRGGGRPPVGNISNNPPWKGKGISTVSSPKVEQLTKDVAGINLESAKDDGEWETTKKSNNRAGSSQNSNAKAWGQPDTAHKVGTGSNGGSGRTASTAWTSQAVDPRRLSGRGNAVENNNVAPQPVIYLPLEHGWNWHGTLRMTNSRSSDYNQTKEDDIKTNEDDADEEEDEDSLDDTDDDDLLSEDFDSDASQQSHETKKKSRWFKKFFESLERLSVEEIHEPERQWHCPACQGGPGAIDWYKGLQPLMTHAKTKGSKRVKLHRELAEVLDEELHRRGTSVIPPGEVFGKWKGLIKEEKDHDIVWPPMVIVMNTRLEKDEDDKWIGMGNQELLDYFNQYAAVKARHSYGPQGHRGMSLLIFESSARGYFEADRLHKHFAEEGTDRNAWERRRVLFYPGGKRQLYGYMATKEDLDIFNQHSHGKQKLRFELRSYNETVVKQVEIMTEDNQQLAYYMHKSAKVDRQKKALEQSLGFVTNKLRKTEEENRIVRQRTQLYHEQQKEELDFQEQFFNDQIRLIHEKRDQREEGFEKLQQEERAKVKQLNANPSNNKEFKHRDQELEKFIKFQDKEMEEYAARRDNLMKVYEEKRATMKRRHLEELVRQEKEFDTELNTLMNKYVPEHSETNN